MFGVGMAFYNQAVGTCSNGGAAHRWYEVGVACAVRWVNDDGQVCFVVEFGYYRQAQGISHIFFESSYAAFTKDDLRISGVDDIFGGKQEFIEMRVHSTF